MNVKEVGGKFVGGSGKPKLILPDGSELVMEKIAFAGISCKGSIKGEKYEEHIGCGLFGDYNPEELALTIDMLNHVADELKKSMLDQIVESVDTKEFLNDFMEFMKDKRKNRDPKKEAQDKKEAEKKEAKKHIKVVKNNNLH